MNSRLSEDQVILRLFFVAVTLVIIQGTEIMFEGGRVCTLRNNRKGLFLLFVCIRNWSLIYLWSLVLYNCLATLVDVVFGQAEYSFLFPPLDPFLTVPLGLKLLIKQWLSTVAPNSCL